MFSLKSVAAGATALALLATSATAETVIRIQSVLGNSSDEVFMLQSFADDVEGLTGGSVKIEILPAGAVVGPRDIMDAVDAGNHGVSWYENLDGEGTFGAKQDINDEQFAPRSVYAIDLDSDGDMDVIAAYYQTDTIEWFENTDGQGTFADGLTVTDTADAANSVFATDIDGDGNIDILSASHNDDTIAWYKNDGSETFVKYVISSCLLYTSPSPRDS